MESAAQYLERVRTRSQVVMAVIMTLAAVYFVRSILFPVALSLLIALSLRPMVRFFTARKVPEFVSALVILAVLLGVFISGVLALAGPVSDWNQNAPRHMLEIQRKLRPVKEAVEEIGAAAEQIQQITEPEETAVMTEVSVSGTPLPAALINATGGMIVNAGIVLSSLFVLLAYGDGFFNAISNLARTHQQQRNILEVTSSVEKMLSRYLMTLSLINAGMGTVVGLGLWALGMPNPLLWGVMAAVLNFIPYLGLLAGCVTVFFVALVSFDDSLSRALMAPLIYYTVNLVESNWVSPVLLGRSLKMNVVVLFMGVLFWGWLWGLGGILIAVPLMAVFLILCEQVKSLQPLAKFLGCPEPCDPVEPVPATNAGQAGRGLRGGG